MRKHAPRAKRMAVLPRRLGAIRELLARDPVCGEIVTYLSRHTQAMDTAPGIAEWWIHREVPPTEEALLKLLQHGVVRSFVVGSARVYAYTKNPHLRQTLAECLPSPNDGGDGHHR